ncbi:MAG: hypothetical protein WCW63_01785 [Acholeplasmataceae bacterium]
MNKYQEQLFAKTTLSLTSGEDKSPEKVIVDDEKITIYQNMDYRKKDYLLTINNSSIESLEISKRVYKTNDGKIDVNISFEEPFDSIIVNFKNAVVDPCSFKVDFVGADKKAFDDKVKSDERKALIKGMGLCVASGHHLLNIYWMNTNDKVAYTSVKLYYGITLLMEQFKIDSGKFYLAIPNLAFGKYSFVIGQYGKDDKLIFETDIIEIDLTDKIMKKLNDIQSSVEKVAGHTRPHILGGR